ncbi:hypothetical protein CRM22_003137 [Opisthorchis felineus]|uniref:U2A'/phosphoprotein 32 family A C-terminal domain-containing protein n=1 Tax=Opisthorchis felineus TaxID=147828 RepID=A0A4S2M8W5_OPIFE|nr:hypothetical protein CRM22_003137 [Opisthorchis felineus]TGZ70536.1 hypothetical protein CRM22_003137 [Opisthorchis felineus]TGZ70537.1 hypothetical protein CRM22_003137 [Opisthorchis felineus]TGZ70538.1 hypothetical protein CRM22_003137 [Opisthorchis felineus]
MKITEYWIRCRVQIEKRSLGDVKTLILQGNCEEKITHLGTALAHFTHLKILDLSRNLLQNIEGIEHIKTLEVLNLYYNSIEDLFEIKRLQCNPNLRDLDLRLNPISRLTADYRRYLSYLLPQLKTLDCRPLRRTESPLEDLLPNSNEEHNNHSKNERSCIQWSTGHTGERFHFGGWKQELLRDSSEYTETPLRSRRYADVQKSAKWSQDNNTKIFPPEESPKIPSCIGVSPCWLDDHVEKQRSALVEYYSPKDAFPNELDLPSANEPRLHTEDTYTNHKERAGKASKDAKSDDSVPNIRKTGDSSTYSGSSVTVSVREPAPKIIDLPTGKKDSQEKQRKENDLSPSGYTKIDQPFLIALKSLIRDAVSESFAQYANRCSVLAPDRRALEETYHLETCVTSSRSEKAALKLVEQPSVLPEKPSVWSNLIPKHSIAEPSKPACRLASLRSDNDNVSSAQTPKNPDKSGGQSRFQYYHEPPRNRPGSDLQRARASSWLHPKPTDFVGSSFLSSSESRSSNRQIHIETYVKDVRQSDQSALSQHHATLEPNVYCLTGSSVLE